MKLVRRYHENAGSDVRENSICADHVSVLNIPSRSEKGIDLRPHSGDTAITA